MIPINSTSTNGERRRHRRWWVGGRLAARAVGIPKASLVDISLAGALVEHSNMMRPGTLLFLTLTLDGQEEVLKCRVIRSVGHRYEVLSTGERDLFYRTGLEFLSSSEASLEVIDKSIESLNRNSRYQPR
ncbi:MAG: PilZ domain-containing protein [Candidatus Methylomirabilales bacterium]